MLTLFMDDCKLRREKVRRTVVSEPTESIPVPWTLIVHYEDIARAKMTPVLLEALLLFLNHGILVLLNPAEFADILKPC